ncbi:MAG TPA: PaaI family thioesterase, partial [Novosphingobium sp.]|nr:PaaI family thioesterase [Novosphingobium sp.]
AFSEQVGPFYACDEGLGPQEHGRFGFRVEPRHCNLRPMCHGGMLATFLDVALARGLRLAGGMAPPLPTISLALDYLAPAPLGAWVEARVSVSRIGRSTGFVSAMIYADDAPVLRGSGVFRHFLARQGVEGAGQ